MSADGALYGLTAEFKEASQLLAATRNARAAGYRRMDAYSPFPIEGLAEALGRERTLIPPLVLAGGIIGGTGGYFMQWFATTIHYPINVGGRPFHSWPSYIPITFELTVLCAAFFALIGMLVMNRLPELHHSIFNAPDFHRASQDRFFLCIEAADPKFQLDATKSFLETLRPVRIAEVEK